MADDKSKLLIEIEARNNTAQGIDAMLEAADNAAGEVAKSFSQIERSLLSGINTSDLQRQAVTLINEITLATLTGAERERAALDIAMERLRDRIAILEVQGGKVDELRIATEELQAVESRRISAGEQQRALDVKQRALELQNSMALATTEGSAREQAYNRIVVQGYEDKIRAIEQQGGEVAELRQGLAALQALQSQQANTAGEQQRIDLEQRLLGLQVQEAERTREIASAIGDRKAVEEATVQIVERRSAVASATAEREIAALRQQYRGRSDLNAILERTERTIRSNADLEARLARATSARAARAGYEAQVGNAAQAVERLASNLVGQLGPVGNVLQGINGQISMTGSGLNSLIGVAGLSTAALVGIGAGAAAIGGVVSALADATRRSQEFESALGPVAARLNELATYEERIAALKAGVRDISSDTGIDEQVLARAVAGASTATRSKAGLTKIVETSAVASLAQQGPADANASELARTLVAYGQQFTEVERIANSVAIASGKAGTSFLDTLRAANDAASTARKLGLSVEDVLAIISDAKSRSGESIEDVRQGFAKLQDTVSDTGSSTRKALADIGVDFPKEIKSGQEFLGVIDQIRARIDEQPNKQEFLARNFGTTSAQRQIGAVLQVSRQGFNELSAEFITGSGRLEQLALEAGNDAGAMLQRMQTKISNATEQIAETFQAFGAGLVGQKFTLPGDVPFPEAASSKMNEILQRLRDGQLDAAKDSLRELEELGTQAGQVYVDAFLRAREQDVDRQEFQSIRQDARASDGYGGVPEFDRKKAEQNFKPELTLQVFTKNVSDLLDIARAAVNDAAASIKPVEVKLEPRIDTLRAEIDAALAGVPLPKLPVEITVPEDVKIADSTLRRLRDSIPLLKDGTPQPADQALGAAEQQKAREAIAIRAKYRLDLEQISDLLADLGANRLVGLERQSFEFSRAEARARRYIDTIKDPAVKQFALRELDRSADTNLGTLRETASKRLLELDQRRLELTASSTEKARDFARANGDVVLADKLAIQAIEERFAAQSKANEIAALATQQIAKELGAYADLGETLAIITQRTKEQAAADREAALAGERRAQAERARASADRVDGLRTETLLGLDAELEKIERNRRAREAADRRDIASGAFAIDESQFNRVLAFYDAIAERDAALARRETKLGLVDGIASQLGSITDSYRSQVQAIELTRAAERERLEESLRGQGAELALRREQLELFDMLTRKQIEQATIGFAGQSSAALAEQRLLVDAYRAAGAAQQDQIDAVSRAKDGARALGEGYEAGLNDALRALNDFDQGVQAGQNRITTFRDSLVEAFESIGEKGKSAGDILRGFAVANLRNVQREAATRASNAITKAVFGEPEPNKAQGPDTALEAAGARLSLAGDRLLIAANALEQTALTANVTAGKQLPAEASGFQLPLGIQGPTPDGDPLEGTPTQQGPRPDGSTLESGAQELGESGKAAGAALNAGAQRAAASLVRGGQGFMSAFLGGAGDKLGGVLTKSILGGLGIEPDASFQFGGVFDGVPVRTLSPVRNRLGGKYSQRTLIEVAEVPGLQEAVVPLQGGAIPLRMPPAPPADPRRGDLARAIESMSRPDSGIPSPTSRFDRAASAQGAPVGAVANDRARRAIEAGAVPARPTRAPVARDGERRERPRDVRVTNAPSISFGGITVNVSGGAASDPRAIAREVAAEVQKSVAAALVSGSDRRLTEAVRGAVR